MNASGHENDERDRVTANGHDDLPGEKGIANAVDGIGSGQKTATGIDPRIETGLPESESERDGIGSDPKIATDHVATVRGRTATEKPTASDALDRSTANGKRSESENDGHGHESCPTESGLYDPSLFLDPKIGKHGRIEKGSGSPKLLSTHHVCRACCDEWGEATEEAARAGRVRCERATSPSAAPEGAEETEARSRATDERSETLPPLSLDLRSSGRRGSLTGHNTRCTPKPPALILPP